MKRRSFLAALVAAPVMRFVPAPLVAPPATVKLILSTMYGKFGGLDGYNSTVALYPYTLTFKP